MNTNAELEKLKKSLKHGDQRVLAMRMGTSPARVSDAFSGFVTNNGFLIRLAAEAKALLAERESTPQIA